MNNIQEAYIEGFCKTAEAHGVDPQELMKVAGPLPIATKLISPVLGWLGGIKRARMATRAGASVADIARARRLGRAAGRSLFGRAAQARQAATNLTNKGLVLTPDIINPGPNATRGLMSPLFRENLPRMERFNNAAGYLGDPKFIDSLTRSLYKGLPQVG